MTFADSDAIAICRGLIRRRRIHENVRVHFETNAGSRACGTAVMMPSIKRAWTFSAPFFTEREQNRAEQGPGTGQVVVDRLFGAGATAVGRSVTLWNQRSR